MANEYMEIPNGLEGLPPGEIFHCGFPSTGTTDASSATHVTVKSSVGAAIPIHTMFTNLSLRVSAQVGEGIQYLLREKNDGIRLSLSLSALRITSGEEKEIYAVHRMVDSSGQEFHYNALTELVSLVMMGGVSRYTRQVFNLPDELGL